MDDRQAEAGDTLVEEMDKPVEEMDKSVVVDMQVEAVGGMDKLVEVGKWAVEIDKLVWADKQIVLDKWVEQGMVDTLVVVADVVAEELTEDMGTEEQVDKLVVEHFDVVDKQAEQVLVGMVLAVFVVVALMPDSGTFVEFVFFAAQKVAVHYYCH